jgi:hypothetical protein
VFSYLGSQPSQRTLDTARRWGVGWLGAATPQARSGLGAALGPGEAFGPLTLYRVPDAPPGVRGDGASVLSVERSAQRIAVRYRAGGEGSVRLSDSYDGAWTASVSSGGAARPAPVLADGEGMQVEVPPGEGEVVLSFGEGAWGAAGALLSLACLAGCALLLARGSAPAQSS